MAPDLETLEFLLRNLREESDLRNTVFDEWIPRLSGSEQERINLWAGRTAVQAQLTEMSFVLGETISAEEFEISDLPEIQSRALDLVAGRLRVYSLLGERRTEDAPRITGLFSREKLRGDCSHEGSASGISGEE
jgi:hypothetical protein